MIWLPFTEVNIFFLFFRLKNVMFEIRSGEEIGVFEVSAKFMGVPMENVELIFQVSSLHFWLFH